MKIYARTADARALASSSVVGFNFQLPAMKLLRAPPLSRIVRGTPAYEDHTKGLKSESKGPSYLLGK
jgi:hypothetical protein